MPDGYTHRSKCRLCGSENLSVVFPLAPTPLGDAYINSSALQTPQQYFPLDLYFCNECGFSQLLDVVDPNLIYRDYIYRTNISLGLPEHFASYARDVLDFAGFKNTPFVVDIGSNDGTLLLAFQQLGARVLGIDPATEIAELATERGVETLPDYFTPELARELKQKYGPASIITANNVMANIDDLDNLMVAIGEWLALDGLFVFETGYLLDLVPNMVFDFIYHEHISYFTLHPLVRFFKRFDMELVRATRVNTKGGSLRGVVKRASNPRPVDPSVAEILALEEAAGINEAQTLRDFACKVDKVKQDLHDLLTKLRGEGKTIAGYGASHSVTTMLHHFDLGNMIDFIVDDNPVKYHTFSPGQHIPVLPSATLVEKQPDYVVVLAWRYFDAIRRKQEAYAQKGGKFIIPLPSVQVKD